MFRNFKKAAFVAPVLSCLLAAGVAKGAVVVSHTGLNDPTTEGFMLSDSTAIAGPVAGDMGRDAWSVDSSGGYYNHRFMMSPAAEADAIANGWVLKMTVRLLTIPDALDFGVYADHASSAGIYQIGFGTQADGDPIIGLTTDSGVTSFVLEGGGSGYHTYEVAYDPAVGSATLSIDGVLRLSGWAGRTGSAPALVNFGSYDVGHANWNELTFSTVPEPSAGLLVALAGGLGISIRRRVKAHQPALHAKAQS